MIVYAVDEIYVANLDFCKAIQNAVPSLPAKPTKAPSLRRLAAAEEEQAQRESEANRPSGHSSWSTGPSHTV